jgi:hypothetical protein
MKRAPSEIRSSCALRPIFIAVPLIAIVLAACNSARFGGSPPAAVVPSVAISITDLPGSWGLASYQTETDKERTVAEAKSACNNPYSIGAGPNGGVTMYLADQNQPSEVFLKVSPDGRTYLGPQGPPGIQPDRLITSFDSGVLVTEWLDPGARQRYGTMVFVRCSAPA